MSVSTMVRNAFIAALSLAVLFTSVTPHPVFAQVVEIRLNNTLRVNGSAFFPIGLLELGNDRYPDWNDRIRRSGANVVWDNGMAYVDSLPNCQAIRDSASAAGYLILAGSPDTWEWDFPATPVHEVEKPMYAADSLSSLISCLGGAGNLIGFANRDEPVWTLDRGVLHDIDSLHVIDTYAQLKTASPTRVVAMNFAPVHMTENQANWQADIGGFIDATDVVMFANYPYPAGPGTCTSLNVLGYPDCSLDRLPEGMALMRSQICRPDQPLWAIVQAFKGIPLKEMRWEAYTSIINGATGIFWAGWSWVHPLGDGADIWATTEQVVSEVSSLHGTLSRYRVYRNGMQSLHPDVQSIDLDEGDDTALLIAASRNGFTGYATMSTGQLQADWAEVLFENRWIPIVNGEFVDAFVGYEAHVYRIDEDFEGTPPPSPPTAIVDPSAGNPDRFRIRVAPNPTTGIASARWELPQGGDVEFGVYDLSGRLVGDVSVRRESPESGWISWSGRGASGAAAPGIYFLRGVAANGQTATARIVWR